MYDSAILNHFYERRHSKANKRIATQSNIFHDGANGYWSNRNYWKRASRCLLYWSIRIRSISSGCLTSIRIAAERFNFKDTTIVDGNGFTWEKIPLIEMRDINTGQRIPGQSTIPVYSKGGFVKQNMVRGSNGLTISEMPICNQMVPMSEEL